MVSQLDAESLYECEEYDARWADGGEGSTIDYAQGKEYMFDMHLSCSTLLQRANLGFR